MSNLDLVDRCVAAYVGARPGQPAHGAAGGGSPTPEEALEARRATLAYVAAAHRLAACALPPKRPSRMRRQVFDFWLPSPASLARSFSGPRGQASGVAAAGKGR